MNKYTGLLIDDETEHIKQSIVDIIFTAKGSRIMRRDYGSNLRKLMDRPISNGLFLMLSSAIVMALQKWEKRIIVQSFKVEITNSEQSYALIGTLTATIKKNGKILTLGDIRL